MLRVISSSLFIENRGRNVSDGTGEPPPIKEVEMDRVSHLWRSCVFLFRNRGGRHSQGNTLAKVVYFTFVKSICPANATFER